MSYIVNYLYLETLPLEFYLLNTFYDYLGGSAVYYLGYYTYGTAITDQVTWTYTDDGCIKTSEARPALS